VIWLLVLLSARSDFSRDAVRCISYQRKHPDFAVKIETGGNGIDWYSHEEWSATRWSARSAEIRGSKGGHSLVLQLVGDRLTTFDVGSSSSKSESRSYTGDALEELAGLFTTKQPSLFSLDSRAIELACSPSKLAALLRDLQHAGPIRHAQPSPRMKRDPHAYLLLHGARSVFGKRWFGNRLHVFFDAKTGRLTSIGTDEEAQGRDNEFFTLTYSAAKGSKPFRAADVLVRPPVVRSGAVRSATHRRSSA